MPDSAHLLDDLNRLGLAPGAAPEALKPAWRRAVSALHPDRHGPQADRELAEVNAAFQRLQAFAHRHGRLPGHHDPAPRLRQPPRTGGRGWMAGALAIAAVFVVLWPQSRPTQAPARTEAESAPSATPFATIASPERPALGLPADRLQAGLEPHEVERIAGAPMFRSAERWEYGPSEVRFTNGRVSGWYSSALRPLPVGDTPSFPAPHGD